MGSDAEIRWVSHLLQLRVDGIVNALTTKTTVNYFNFGQLPSAADSNELL